jgi:hypothetical protein
VSAFVCSSSSSRLYAAAFLRKRTASASSRVTLKSGGDYVRVISKVLEACKGTADRRTSVTHGGGIVQMHFFGEAHQFYDVSDQIGMLSFENVERFFPGIRSRLNESRDLIL